MTTVPTPASTAPRARGFSLRTFFSDGQPDGVQLVDHSQWLGRGMIVPRAELDHALPRPEMQGTGVYVLCGPNPATACERVYIGQLSTLRDTMERLRRKSFWDRMIVFTLDGPRLHRAHTDYIEARLLEIARSIRAAEVENTRSGAVPSLFEADVADAEYFLQQIVSVAPTMGVGAFTPPAPMPAGASLLRLNASGASAAGYAVRGRFVVQNGATLSRKEAPGCPGYIADLRASLLARGAIADDGKQMKLAQDMAFATMHQAAMVLTGEKAEGEQLWKNASGQPASQAVLGTNGHGNGAGNGAGRTPGNDESQELPAINVKAGRTPVTSDS